MIRSWEGGKRGRMGYGMREEWDVEYSKTMIKKILLI